MAVPNFHELSEISWANFSPCAAFAETQNMLSSYVLIYQCHHLIAMK